MEEVPPSPSIIRFGVFELDLESGELRRNGLKVKLHDQPFQILAMLLERPGRLVSREELQKRLWPDDTFVDFDHSLNAAVKKLRQALGDDADNPRFVETLPRRGYRFIAPVAPVSPPAAGAAMTTSPLQSRWLVAMAILVPVATVAALLALNVARLRDRLFPRPAPTIHSLAVVPLENLSGDPEQDYFADGMTDELITRLAQIRAVHVISRGSVMQYKGAKKSTAEIARELNVDAVVEGAVMRSGDRVRISAQLIEGPSDRHLWASSYERDLSNILTLQSELARAIAREIRAAVTPEEETHLAKARPVNPEAYELYLRSRVNAWRPETVLSALEYAQQAIEKDPDFALGYTALVNAYASMTFSGLKPAAEAFPKAKEAALKALEIDETLPEPHASLGLVKMTFEWDWSGAEREFLRALELAPNRSEFHSFYGSFLLAVGRVEEALAEIERAVKLNPLGPREGLARVYVRARRYDDAIREAKQSLQLNPNSPSAHAFLASAYSLQGKYEEFFGVLEKRPDILALTAEEAVAGRKVYETRGYQGFVNWLADQFEMKGRQGQPVDLYRLVWTHAGANHRDEAFRLLEKAYEQRHPILFGLKSDPWYDPLRSDPRFQDLLRRMNFPE